MLLTTCRDVAVVVVVVVVVVVEVVDDGGGTLPVNDCLSFLSFLSSRVNFLSFKFLSFCQVG